MHCGLFSNKIANNDINGELYLYMEIYLALGQNM